MRLSKLKLSGFKSFVDPTSINLPSSRVAIVGPNGCGKSNTIDAVRWVMGESSAKNLRGDSMDDVIFTGSSSRKPVGQASVELVFDNADGSVGGEYAAYAEIAIRREVTRDGQSKYFLNNARCRRRDIKDIFLGTGLGPRSYAIIEQGMISRLIEAKPEDMRVFLEEAAGISKYKERRKETETRIRHTRDNLDRLDDLREEVEKQITHLKRQANTAERYRLLKDDEKLIKGQLLGLRWTDFQKQLSGHDDAIKQREVELEEIIAELRAAEVSIEQDRQNQVNATEQFNQMQADYYRLGSEVSRIEQSIAHTKESRAQQTSELQQIEDSLKEAQQHIEQDETRISEIDVAMENDGPAYDKLQESQKYSVEMLSQAETKLQEWQSRWDEFSGRNGEATQTAQVELSRMDQLERGVGQLDKRIDRLSSELSSLNVASLASNIESWISNEVGMVAEEARLQKLLESSGEELQNLRDSLQKSTAELDETRSQSQGALGRLASLEALQQAALGQNDQNTGEWLRSHHLAEVPRVAQQIVASPGWEKAVETVLDAHLEALCIDDVAVIDAIVKKIDEFSGGHLAFVASDGSSSQKTGLEPSSDAKELLANKINTSPALSGALADVLAGVYCVKTFAEALVLKNELRDGESIVTQDGMCLGRTWLRIGETDLEGSVLQREQEIGELRETLKKLKISADAQQQRCNDFNSKLEEHEARRETLQTSFNQSLREVSEVKSQLASGKQQLEQLHGREARLNEELEEARQIKRQDEEQVKTSRARRAEALDLINQLTTEAETLQQEQLVLKDAHELAKDKAESERSAGQEIAIRVESMKTARVSTTENLQRMKAQLTQYGARRVELSALLASEDVDPILAMESSLAEYLEAHVASEAALSNARSSLEEVEQRLRSHEQSRVRHDSRAANAREGIQTMRMESQEARVRLKTMEEQMIEGEYDRELILAQLPEEANANDWAERATELERKIQRLGPINLAAIDEYDQQIERKEYLDSQHADVVSALETLEKAIAKIDRETRQRFKDTFDKVNEKVQAFFPRLFGGGEASLQMTGDDLLNTGVTVLAQPPGKHVTNIHLLSGGEKALTAVAVVFAFFELNPSPFCMLDEVDAPLDDANVGRFCELVKEMSERVQFIIITHNKVTMELADQLLGVTMNEPGVSRLVAVDVHEAVELATA